MRWLPHAVALATAIGALVPAGAEGGGRDRALLEEHRPVLRYDTAEQYFAQPVSRPPASAGFQPGDRVYGHVATEEGRTWLQYWLYYSYNSQDRSPLDTGRHEGDWELVQFRLDSEGEPDLATLSQHSWAEGCAGDELELGPAGAPVVYVANGSHANYAHAGSYGRPFPDPTDEAGGRGRQVRPPVEEITDESPSWVAYPGPWGDSEAGWFPGEESSPVGPRFQESGAWTSPAAYHEERSRPCGSGAPGRPVQTAATLVVAGLLLFGGVLLAVRRRD